MLKTGKSGRDEFMTDNHDDVFEILSTNDEKTKKFGELLSNDSSRMILNLIYQQEMTSLEIAQKTGFSLELVRYHVQKMITLGIVQISKIEKSSKEQDMKYYRVAKAVMIVLPHQVSEKIKSDKIILKLFNKSYRLAAVGIVAALVWIISQKIQSNPGGDYVDFGPSTLFEKIGIHGDPWISIALTLSTILTGILIINYKKFIPFKNIFRRYRKEHVY
jgi:predicted transcriptional regulator